MEGASNAFAHRHQSRELRLRVVNLEKCFEMRRVHSRPLLSLEESALMLGIGRSTLYRAVKDGNVPFPIHKIGAVLVRAEGFAPAIPRRRRCERGHGLGRLVRG